MQLNKVAVLVVAGGQEEYHISLEHFLKLMLAVAVGLEHLLEELKDQLQRLGDDDVGFAEHLALLLPVDPLVQRLVDYLERKLGLQHAHVLRILLSAHL